MVKSLPANAGDTGDAALIPGSERSPGGENCNNSLQHSCLEDPMDKEPGRLQSTGLQRLRHNQGTGHKQVHTQNIPMTPLQIPRYQRRPTLAAEFCPPKIRRLTTQSIPESAMFRDMNSKEVIMSP